MTLNKKFRNVTGLSLDVEEMIAKCPVEQKEKLYNELDWYIGLLHSTCCAEGKFLSDGSDRAETLKEIYNLLISLPHLTLSDTQDLTTLLPAFSITDCTITLDRKVYSGWNTFCVPFALTQAQLEEAYGSGTVAKYLSGVNTSADGVTLNFTPEEKGGIEANKAYMLYLNTDVTEPKTFSGVTLQPASECETIVSTDNGDYIFKGILAPTAPKTDGKQYILNSDGTNFVLPLPNSTGTMKATRAYIIVPSTSIGDVTTGGM